MNENSKVRELKGIGEKTEQLFRRLNIETVGDLLRYYPRTYQIYEAPTPIQEVKEGEVVTITGRIMGKIQVSQTKNLSVTTITVQDETAKIRVSWFRMPFLRTTLSAGGVITLRGRIVNRKGTLVMEHPEIFYPSVTYQEKMHTMQPVYSLTSGMSNRVIMKAVKQAVSELEMKQESLPERIRQSQNLAEYNFAIQNIHFPENKEQFYLAHNRLVFEEFFLFILAVRRLGKVNRKLKNEFSFADQGMIQELVEKLPYELTRAQERVWKEILQDLQSPFVMSRLVQGDVGSGKTILATLALVLTAENGMQGAIMAPTEVLAKQHYESIKSLMKMCGFSISVVLLTGSMTTSQKRETYKKIESGEAKIIIGTHALIQDKVNYQNLALVVTDEQHRFGVKQRECFANKGTQPHVLVMSATPIPRTLAMIIYGDLDVSVVDELPANRLPIKNCVVDTGYRNTAYAFMEKQIQEGHQCYVICPMVEESEQLEAENVMDYAQMLQDVLGKSVKVSSLHGRMKQDEKDAIMEKFSENKIQVLVSTTVIEVGINVPNATVMMVENAERFGLAQLHQLRGRVGRGKAQSYCIFMSSSKTKEAKERLSTLVKSNDGFFIASEDLRLRGPGDLFGVRQSGIMDFRLGDVFQDAQILQDASKAAEEVLNRDPELKNPEHENLRRYLETYMKTGLCDVTL